MVFEGVPLVEGAEDAAGTVATGAVDTLIADPGNALLGVNADNMGIFEENAAGAKVASIATLGLGGEGGLLTDVLLPGKGRPGEGAPERRERRRQKRRRQQMQTAQGSSGAADMPLVLILFLGLGGAAFLLGVSE